jgi:hypothetical protein
MRQAMENVAPTTHTAAAKRALANTVMSTANTAAAKRTPSGIFARPASALADGGLAH